MKNVRLSLKVLGALLLTLIISGCVQVPPEGKVIINNTTVEDKSGRVVYESGYTIRHSAPYHRSGGPYAGEEVTVCTRSEDAVRHYEGEKMSGEKCFPDIVTNGRPRFQRPGLCIYVTNPRGSALQNYYVVPGYCPGFYTQRYPRHKRGHYGY